MEECCPYFAYVLNVDPIDKVLSHFIIKGALSGLRQVLATEGQKALFGLKIFKFLS